MDAMVYTGNEGGKCRVARRLFHRGATSAWSAQEFEPRNRRERSGLASALASGLVVRTEAGTYFVDPDRYERMRVRQRWAITIGIAVVLVMMAVLFLLGEFN